MSMGFVWYIVWYIKYFNLQKNILLFSQIVKTILNEKNSHNQRNDLTIDPKPDNLWVP